MAFLKLTFKRITIEQYFRKFESGIWRLKSLLENYILRTFENDVFRIFENDICSLETLLMIII